MVPSHLQYCQLPEELAGVLWSASPDRAWDFARAEHEKACWDVGGDRADFWAEVLDILAALAEAARRAVSLRDRTAA